MDTAVVRAELARVLASASFTSSQRLQQFLRYIVQETISGRGDQIKEYSIGISVYGKPPSYDPKIDATVRGEATRLRVRLREYYAAEGKDSPIQLQLPKGKYIPVIVSARETDEQRLGSIAVLPFNRITPASDEDEDALGLAIADAVITNIGSWGTILVRPTSAVRRYRAPGVDAIDAGRQLQVEAVMEGSFQVVENRIRLSAQLLRVSTGKHIWTGIYDETFGHIFSLQNALAAQLAGALRVPLKTTTTPIRDEPANPEAYGHFARGHHHFLRLAPDANARAIAAFEQAIIADPGFAAAHARLALAYIQQADLMMRTFTAVSSKAKYHVHKALNLQPDLPEALASLATFQYRCEWNWDAALRSFEEGLRLNPNSFQGLIDFATLLDGLGRLDDALSLKRRALLLDPASPLVYVSVGLFHWFRREYDQAIEWSQLALELDPYYLLAHERIAAQLYKRGDYDRWSHHLIRAVQLSGADEQRIVSMQEAWRHNGPNGLLTAVSTARSPDSVSRGAAWFSFFHAELGQLDRAFASLEQALEMRSGPLVFLKMDPGWDNLRPDPRFSAMLQRMGLV